MSINIPGSESDSKIIQFNPTLPLIRYLKLYWKNSHRYIKRRRKNCKNHQIEGNYHILYNVKIYRINLK